MRFIHTSDIHIGAKFEMLGEKAPLQREQIKQTFSKIVEYGKENKVDLFLISGDLFDAKHPSRPSLKDVEFVKSEFLKLTGLGVKICLIPGNHDYYIGDKADIGKEFEEMENVFIFNDPDGQKLSFKDLKTEIYAKANIGNKSSNSPMPKVDSSWTAFKIIMAHGGVVGQAKKPEYPIQPKEIENSGADYIALGDWHSMRDESRGNVKAYYCGSPEMISLTQANAGYFIFGETEGEHLIKIEPVQIGTRKVKKIEIDLAEIKNVSELKDKIKESADENLILSAAISGINKNKLIIDLESVEDELALNFWRLIVENKSQLPIEDFNEEDYPSYLITGQFLEIMKQKIKGARSEDEKKLYEEALHTGLLAFQDPDIIV